MSQKMFIHAYTTFWKIIKNHLSFFLELSDESKFLKSVRALPLSIKLMNPVDKYPHIIEFSACI